MAVLNHELRLKGELLATAALKEPQPYLQLYADDEGMSSQGVWELRSTDIPVRVQILAGTSKADAITLLRKLTDWAEQEWATHARSMPTDPARGVSRGPSVGPVTFDDDDIAF